jgi:type II secretion system protein N
LKKILFLLVASAAIVWGLWAAIPVTAIESIIEDSVRNQHIEIKVNGLKKGLFYSLRADGIVLKHTESEIISLHSLQADVNPLHLVALRVDLSVSGYLGEGSFSGDASLSRKKAALNLDFRQARLNDMRFLSAAGIRGRGTVSGNIVLTDQKGLVKFLVKDAELEPVIFQGVPAPLNFFRTIQGSVDIDVNTIDVASVSLEGPNIFARLRGTIRNNFMDLRMEVMPEKVFLENPLLLSQVDRYQISPGYYVIPVNGPLVF